MAEMKYLNDATTVLASAVTETDASMEVTSSSDFPVLSTGDWFWATIRRAADGAKEQVRVTAIAGTTWSVERSSTPLAFSVGDGVFQRMNAQFADDMLRPDMQVLGRFSVAGGTADAMTATLSKPARSLVDGIEISIRAIGANTIAAPTLDLDGLGAVTMTKMGGNALAVGEIPGAGYELELRYRESPSRWELLNPAYGQFIQALLNSSDAEAARTVLGIQDLTAPLKIAVHGASETSNPAGETWVDHVRTIIGSEGLNINFYATGNSGHTCYQALNIVDPYNGSTTAELTSQSNPDVIILEFGINDAITKADGRTEEEILQDLTDLVDYYRTNNPSAILVHSRLTPYDEDHFAAVHPSLVKRKACGPWMHETSTVTGDTGLYTSESKHLEEYLSTTMQSRLSQWRAFDSLAQLLVDHTIETNYFRPTRLGLTTMDRAHFNSIGQYWTAWYVWTAFQTDAALRADVPELTAIRQRNQFPDFDQVWSSVLKLDSYGDGYEFDPDFLDGTEWQFWEGLYSIRDLTTNIACWGNQKRPNIDYTTVLDQSNGDPFTIEMANLYPGQEVQTKLWTGSSEPTSWSSFPVPRYITPTGGYMNVTSNISGFSIGTWYLKIKVGNDSFGPYPITVVA
jgi:hypothetical protein